MVHREVRAGRSRGSKVCGVHRGVRSGIGPAGRPDLADLSPGHGHSAQNLIRVQGAQAGVRDGTVKLAPSGKSRSTTQREHFWAHCPRRRDTWVAIRNAQSSVQCPDGGRCRLRVCLPSALVRIKAPLARGGDVDRQLTNAHFGLPTSPWLTYKSDSKGDENADSGLEFIARSWSWPFFAAGAALICLGSRIARRPNQADIKTDVPARQQVQPD